MSSSATRRSTRALAALAAAVVVPAAAVALASPALAGYAPSTPQCSSATGEHTPGSAVTLTGIGFTPGQTVTVGGLGGAVVLTKTTKADSAGSVSVKEQLGNGLAQFTLSGTKLSAKCGLISVMDLTTTRPSTPATSPTSAVRTTTPPQNLAVTGAAHLGDYATIGGGLLLAGGGLVALGLTRKPKGAHR